MPEHYALDEICGRCLVNINATVTIRAIFPDGKREFCDCATNPVALKKWVEDRRFGDNYCRFEVDATTDRFRPVSTWHGDPVCSWHLWVLVDGEAKAYAKQGIGIR